jgi:hypothetical protein
VTLGCQIGLPATSPARVRLSNVDRSGEARDPTNREPERVVIRAREALGGLYLLWCVRNDDHSAIVEPVDGRPFPPEAWQLRVKDVAVCAVRQGLSTYRRGDGRMVLASIMHLRERLAEGVEVPDLDRFDPPRAFRVTEGLVVREGNHRLAALFLSGQDPIDLELLVDRERGEPFARYDDSHLRVRPSEDIGSNGGDCA